VIVTETGVVGSIGVVMLHLDQSKRAEMEGVKPTFIYAGAHKVDGNTLEPLDPDVKEQLQEEVDAYYAMFTKAVGKGRSTKGFDAKAARETEARIFIGADAVKNSLADDVGTFEEVLADIQQRRAARKAASHQGSQAMSRRARTEDDADDDPVEIPIEVEFEGKTYTGVDEVLAVAVGKGAQSQIDRFTAILASEKVKGREKIAIDLACKSPAMTVDQVVAFVGELEIAAAAPSTRPIADRTRDTGADQVGNSPSEPPGTDEKKARMKAAADKQNARTRASAPKGVKTALAN
jgi:ClpP class serine protease